MADVLHSRFVNFLIIRVRCSRAKSAAGFLFLAASFLILPASVLAQSASSQAARPDQGSSAQPASPPPAQIWLPPLQSPAHEPVIDWDGKLLTIDAENSALSDILLGIRFRTGTPIEMPGSTKSERVAVHLGPAPIREVISALLYGTDFNYVIQSSDDKGKVRRVIVTAKDAEQIVDDPVEETHLNNRSGARRRLPPGYTAPVKRDSEAAPSAMDDSSSTIPDPPAADLSASVPEPSSETVMPDPAATNSDTDAQRAAANATDPASSGEKNSLTAADHPNPDGAAGTAVDKDPGETPTAGTPPLSREQRQQLQAQQNHPAQTNAP